MELEEAIAAWVRAEYHFRCGPNAYQGPEGEALWRSETKLRRALTGKGDLAAAFARLGGVPMPDRGLNPKTGE